MDAVLGAERAQEPEEVSRSLSATTLLAILAVIVAISIGFEHGKDALFHVARRGTGVSLVNTLFGGELHSTKHTR